MPLLVRRGLLSSRHCKTHDMTVMRHQAPGGGLRTRPLAITIEERRLPEIGWQETSPVIVMFHRAA